MNLANAVEALCGPEGRFSPLAKEAQREGKEALAAAGIDVASSQEDRERRADHLQLRNTSSGEWSGGSSWQTDVAGVEVAPQQSRLLVHSVAAEIGPGASHAASVK